MWFKVPTSIVLKYWEGNEMAEWHCFKCKKEMVEDEVRVMYLDLEGEAEGLVCPQCGRFSTAADATRGLSTNAF